MVALTVYFTTEGYVSFSKQTLKKNAAFYNCLSRKTLNKRGVGGEEDKARETEDKASKRGRNNPAPSISFYILRGVITGYPRSFQGWTASFPFRRTIFLCPGEKK